MTPGTVNPMCKSLAEGGQRCAAHTRAKLETKATAVEAAVNSGDAAALRAAQTEWEDAAAEYASTDEGHRHLAAHAAAAEKSGDLHTAALLGVAVRRGEDLRAANRETAALIAAVRLTQTEPAPVVKDTLTPERRADLYDFDNGIAPVPARVVVPDLTPAERKEWVEATTELDALLPDIQGITGPTGSTVISPNDLRTEIPKIDTVLSDPDADDQAIARAIRMAAYYRDAAKFSHPRWTAESADAEGWAESARTRSRALDERWLALRPKFTDALDAQAERALNHPNAGSDTFEQALSSRVVTSVELTSRSDLPMSYLKKVVARESSGAPIHETSWQRIREASFTDMGLAMHVAAKDPDSFQRTEAFNRVMTAPFDTMSESDRRWLASNLHRMPGSEESQRILASSLKSWALGYTDANERKALGSILLVSNNPEVSTIGRSLLGGDPPKERKKRLFY